MRNRMFVFYLLLMLTLMSCSKTEIGFNGQVYLYLSEPEVNRYPVEKGDSIVVKGFNSWTIGDEHKGMLPDSVVRDSGYDKSYVSYICAVTAEFKMNEEDFIIMYADQNTKLGYSFPDMGYIGVSNTVKDYDSLDDSFVMNTYLIYISQEKDGKKMDIWYPCSPFDLEWHCFSFKDIDVKSKEDK